LPPISLISISCTITSFTGLPSSKIPSLSKSSNTVPFIVLVSSVLKTIFNPFASYVSSSYCPTLGVPVSSNVIFAFPGAESLSINPPMSVDYSVISAIFVAVMSAIKLPSESLFTSNVISISTL